MSGIADAIHADAEAARAEIRAEGIICPSCGVNMADLPRDHMLDLDLGGVDWQRAERRPPSAQCAAGDRVNLDNASYETWQAAANVNLLDKFREAEDKAWGLPPRGAVRSESKFTGLLDVLREDTGS